MVAIQAAPAEATSPEARAMHTFFLSFRSLARRADGDGTGGSGGGGGGLSGGAIAGIIIGVLLALALGFLLIYCCKRGAPLPGQRLGPSGPSGLSGPSGPAKGMSFGRGGPFSKAFSPPQPQEMYLPQYTGPTQPAYTHTHGLGGLQQGRSMPGVVYPVQPQSTYYASQHHQAPGVRFGEVGVRRI